MMVGNSFLSLVRLEEYKLQMVMFALLYLPQYESTDRRIRASQDCPQRVTITIFFKTIIHYVHI